MLILASASPRRAQLLSQIGVVFNVIPADIDESPYLKESPADYVERLAVAKAQAVAASSPANPVLAADTTVVIDGLMLGKPASMQEGQNMLRQLSGRRHDVYTGVALAQAGNVAQIVTCTRVHFRDINDDEQLAYWRSGEPADKAGGYAIQGLGAMFVTQIEGSYSGVVGLPLAQTANLLMAADVATGLLMRDAT